jgi:acyl carrier protein
MSREPIRKGVADLLSITLGRRVSVEDSVKRENEPGWDSLKHVELILMVEENFGIHFTEEEMAALSGSDDIVASVETKNASQH